MVTITREIDLSEALGELLIQAREKSGCASEECLITMSTGEDMVLTVHFNFFPNKSAMQDYIEREGLDNV